MITDLKQKLKHTKKTIKFLEVDLEKTGCLQFDSQRI